MKTHKCFKRLSLTSGLVLVFLNTACAEGKDDWCGTCPELLYSCHSLELVSAEAGWDGSAWRSRVVRPGSWGVGVFWQAGGRGSSGVRLIPWSLCAFSSGIGEQGVEALCLKQRKNAEFCSLLLQSLSHRF